MFFNTPNIPEISVTELQQFIDQNPEKDYLLVDVREPDEYQKEHIPGAILVPLMDLVRDHVKLDLPEHTFFYCHSGARSVRAAQVVMGRQSGSAGKIYSVAGGIISWRGDTLPDAPRLRVFDATEDLEQLLLRAMDLEKGAELLYGAVHARFENTPQAASIKKLMDAEEGHARALYSTLKKVAQEPPRPFEELYGEMRGLVLESGEPLAKLLPWLSSTDGDPMSVLEMALDMELKAYDLYRNLAHASGDPEMERAFLDLANEEQRHASIVTSSIGRLAA